MDFLLTPVSEGALYEWELWLGEWFFLISLGFLGFELIRYTVMRKMNWTLAGDTVTNFISLTLFYLITFVAFGAFYLGAFSWAAQFAVFDIPINLATVLICILLADLVYYWEHRFLHRVNLGWATHTVHHSSPFFNISVAYRFGPLDGVYPLIFHLPLALLGFNPAVILLSELFVQLYQTALHTESVKKLPKPVEAVFNTPSHHRVHHGSNPAYLDTNYAGILIIWDRLFGTFAKEEETVVYGLVEPINSINPLTVFFHGLGHLLSKVWRARSASEVFSALFSTPDWDARAQPRKSANSKEA